MGKTTGFIEYRRSLPILRPSSERLSDWSEFHAPLDAEEISTQAARCMNCGTPFCHVGESFDGVTKGCPLHNLIPEWNDLVYLGRHEQAYERLIATNNFPEFTGRVCPAPCESSCILGINDDPVMIKEIEVAIIDRAFEEGLVVSAPPAERTGHSVAVIGSGPAGLACSDELNKLGHEVTVFERDDRIGGLLMYGIPNMKLDKAIVERRVGLLQSAGVSFKTSASVGVNISAKELVNDYDSVVLCTGSPKPRDLSIVGREASGIHFAMEFLTENTKQLLGAHSPRTINVTGKDVIVIGGGDTGTDCVGTSLRLGCKSLVQLEIMPQPPSRVADHDHWLARSREFEIDYGQEESIEKFGADPRAYSLLTKRFVADEHGALEGVETVSVEWVDGKLTEIGGSENVWKADVVFLALGFTGVEKGKILEEFGVELTERNTIRVDGKKQTSVPGIFAAGDCERGQSLVVWAIADGRRAAYSVDRYFREKATIL
ncbi:MAG: glutamate synthase subunit beta [Pyrinomonadaceae bacterium]